jgi:hypothetical protein
VKWLGENGLKREMFLVLGCISGSNARSLTRYFRTGAAPDWTSVAATVVGSIVGIGISFVCRDWWRRRKANQAI